MPFDGEFPRYVSAAERQLKAARAAAKLRKKGRVLAPVTIRGRKIAESFWGHAWCTNLEAYSDYESRLPRGRTYARNGSVVDLQVEAGHITALVQGSDLYRIRIAIEPLAAAAWKRVRERSTGKLGTLVELLQGKLSHEVMSVITDREHGLFPKPREIEMSCSCPDGARMCKHVAAVLYGVGARLDEAPQLLFVLRGVDHTTLLDVSTVRVAKTTRKTIAASELDDIFGIPLGKPTRKRSKT